MTLEEVKARIRVLMSRTTAAGCTEAEAMVAAAAAMRLMREHGLDPDQVQCSQEVMALGRRSRAPIDRLWPIVAHVCRCVTWSEEDADGLRYVYFGRDPWPDVAAWLHGLVKGAQDRAVRDFTRSAPYQARRKPKTRAAARKAFVEGFVAGLRRPLWNLLDLGDEEQREADLAIATQAKAKLGLTFVEGKAAPASKLNRRYANEVMSGHGAGRSTQLRWGVSSSGEQLAIEGPKG